MVLPEILAGVSSRLTSREPISRKDAGAFSFGFCGTGRLEARAASAPKCALLPDGLCATTPFSTVISAAATCHSAAAAATSISRAAAAASRSCIHEFATDVEPPVPCKWKIKLLYSAASAGANSARICAQSASSSSATMVLRPVVMPWPLSRCLMITVTVLSGAILMKAFGIGAILGASCASAGSGICVAITNAALAVAEPFNQSRRERRGVCRAGILNMTSGPHHAGRFVNGSSDAHIGRAAANISVHGAVDISIAGRLVLAQERDGAHDLPGLAIAALNDVELGPCGMDSIRCLAGNALDRRNS